MRWKGKGRRALSFLLALVLALSLLPASALAEGSSEVARISGKSYSSIEDAWKAVPDGGTINLMKDCTISSRLILDSDKRITILMNGHKISRDLSSDTRNGEVICVERNASLTLKGDTTKSTIKYTGWIAPTSTKDTEPERQANMSISTGGLITGGWSTNGAGGIHMKDGASLTLDNVAVAGNRAYRPVISDGYGGGVMMAGQNAQLILKNGAEVSHNAGFFGGGVYIDGSSANITMSGGSKIDNNYAEKDGGGLYSNSTYTTIAMTGGSTINQNSANEGGGIYFNYSYLSVKSADASGSISGNKARIGSGGAICVAANRTNNNIGTIYGITLSENSAKEYGGALYIHQESIVTSGCKLTNNSAEYGGGFYNDNDKNTISDTEITGNTAEKAGGGVFSSAMNDITLSGKVIIKDNKRSDNSADDLYLNDTTTTTAYLVGSPSGQSEIGIRTETQKERKLGKNQEFYYENAFFYNGSGYHIEFDEDKSELWLKKGDKTTTIPSSQKISNTTATQDSTKGTVNGKPVIKGYFSYPSVVETKMDLDSVFYYSDGYFLDEPKTYNEHLATMSMAMAMAGFYSNIGNDGSLTENDRTYTYKSQNIEKLLTDIGVEPDNIYISNSNSVKPGTDTIGVAIGQKTIGTDSDSNILVPIAIRGAGYESEWYSNTTLGASGEHDGFADEHAGFASAATQVVQQVQSYIDNYNLTDKVNAGKVKFWIAGYSRAGATANLTAKRLIEAYCYNTNKEATGNQVYAYCFEAPKGGLNSAMTLSADKYYCIHNCINKADAVPLVAPEEMGFIRYGVDHYVPGTETGTVASDSTVWSYVKNKVPSDYKTWSDNRAYGVGKTANSSSEYYQEQRPKMLDQLKAVDPKNIYFYDRFQMAQINYIAGGAGLTDLISSINPEESLTQEEFVRLLVRSLQSWGLYHSYEGDFRKGYNTQYSDKSASFEQALQTVTKILFSKSSAELNGMMEAAGGAMDRLALGDLFDIWDDMIGDWTSLSQSKRDSYLQQLWNVVMEQKSANVEHTAAYYLTSSEKAELRSVWDVLLDVLLRFVEVDYNTAAANWNKSTTPVKNPTTGTPAITPVLEGITNQTKFYTYVNGGRTDHTQVVLGTLAKNATAIMQAHYPEINFAWLRSFDNYYDNDKTPVEIKTTTTPTVISKIGETEITNATNDYQGTQTLTLSTNVKGAGIYYRIQRGINDYSDWMPYNKPIQLEPKGASDTAAYRVQTTAVYCGNVSAVNETLYRIGPTPIYVVQVNGPFIGFFKEGDIVTIDGTPTDNDKQMFKKWVNTDKNVHLKNENSIVTTFTMPANPVSITAEYYTRIGSVSLTVEAPEAGKPLNTTGTLSWGEDKSKDVYVAWVRVVGTSRQPAFGNAAYNTTYYPVVSVDQNLDDTDRAIMVFKSSLDASDVTINYGQEDTSNQVDRAYVNAEGMLAIYGKQVTTAKAKVESVPAYVVNIPKDSVTSTDALKERLPKKVTVSTEDGDKTLDLSYTDEELNKVDWNTENTYDITATINYSGLNVDYTGYEKTQVHINVYSNGVVAAPTATLDSGTYPTDQTVRLSSETSGATISGTVKKSVNGADATTETFNTTNTTLNLTGEKGKKVVYTITAKATAAGQTDSPEVTFTYVIEIPLPEYTVTINGTDTGTKGQLWTKTYTYTEGDAVIIGAPEEEDEAFEKWESADGITIEDTSDNMLTVDKIQNNITLTAVYNPVIKELKLTIPEPTIGVALGNKVTDAIAKVTNENNVTALFGDIQWSPTLPTDGKPSYDTAYTAKLTLSSYEYDEHTIKFFLSENLKLTVNKNSSITATAVQEADGKYAIYVTFPATGKAKLASVAQPGNGHATRAQAAKSIWNLPTTTTLTLEDGSKTSTSIAWTVTGYDANTKEAQVLTATGTVTIPTNVEQGSVPNTVTAKVYVDAADQVAMPTASLSSGSYTGEQVLRLSCETEKATIYYTLDGSDPTPDAAGTIQYTDGGIITLPNSTAVTELHVIAVKEGMRQSTMAMYRYDVTRQSSGGSGGSSKPVNPPEDQPSTGGSDYKNCSHGSTCPLTKFTDLNANAWYHDGVHYCLDSGLMAGYGNALFGPNDKLSRAQVVTVLWRMAKSPAPTAENSFTDVPADTWYTDAVRWAAENGVVGGYGDGRFGPNDPVTREQMAAMFYRFAKQQGRDVTQRADLGTYADAASVSDWAKEALQWACGAGLINGMDGSLVPQGTATRAQTAAVLQRLSALTQ